MVEVFKTNVQRKAQSEILLCALAEAFPAFKINFDLSDCDKVLRVEGHNIDNGEIIRLLNRESFLCETLQ